MSLAPVVAERVRRSIPPGLSVLPGSLPVVSFGDPSRAVVATLSLNPSWIEFQSPAGVWLRGRDRRLASLVSLRAGDARDLDDDQVEQVVVECNGYFRGPNWYRTWFHWLESLLQDSQAGSYFDGSACHLDLVQWATKPAQGKLAQVVWDRLVEQDRDFLRWQLAASNVRAVLLNGASVVRWVQQAGLVSGLDESILEYRAANGLGQIRMSRAVAAGVLFIGWNKPLAGALAADGRRQLSRWVGEALDGHERDGDVGDRLNAERHGAAPELGDALSGCVPAGTFVDGALELETELTDWARESDQPTVGDVGTFGGSPVITVRIGTDVFVLNGDTKRAAVQAFLAAADRAGGADCLGWHVTANRKGTINRVSYRADDEHTPGWYAYLHEASSEPRELG